MKIKNIKIQQATIEYGHIIFTLSNDWSRNTIGEINYTPFSGSVKLPIDSEKSNELFDKFRNNEYIELEI